MTYFAKLDGRGSPLRLMAEGGLRPDGFGIPVEPTVIFVRPAVALMELVFIADVLLVIALGALIPMGLFRL